MNNKTENENISEITQKPNRIGLIVLVVLIVGVAITLVFGAQKLTPVDDVTSPLASKTNVGSHFNADVWFLPSDEFLGFVEIPAGQFVMGSDPTVDKHAYPNERWSADEFQGSINLSGYYIARFEVTVGQFSAFVADTHYKADERSLKKSEDFPVTYVSWPDALAYCHWLEKTLRDSDETPEVIKKLLADGWEITLPSEAQWEKAARGLDGRIYPWGNRFDVPPAVANIDSSVLKPVGNVACDECSFGLSDMSGNVWELTRSPYRPYPFSEVIDSALLSADALYVMRGGSYNDDINNARAAVRGGVDPGVRESNIGFRLVLQGKIALQ